MIQQVKASHVCLYHLTTPMLVMKSPTGVIYQNQTGGYACNQPMIEGYAVPFGDSNLSKQLLDFFVGPEWNGWCCDGINEATAKFIETLLQPASEYASIEVSADRGKMAEGQEAWVPVTVKASWDIACDPLGFSGEAILTWENSD